MNGPLDFFDLNERWLPQMREIDGLSFCAADQWEDAFYASIFTRSDLCAVAARVGGRLVGYALLDTGAPAARVRSIAVHPSDRNKGYGEALMRRVIGQCSGRIELVVDPHNTHAVRLYERLGFRFEGGCAPAAARRSMYLTREARL